MSVRHTQSCHATAWRECVIGSNSLPVPRQSIPGARRQAQLPGRVSAVHRDGDQPGAVGVEHELPGATAPNISR